MKRLIFTFIIATICGISAFADNYDFSAVCSSGQMLYYKIINPGSAYFRVEVVSENASSPYYSTYPTGDLIIPSAVTYRSNSYSVYKISAGAFKDCSRLTSVTIPSTVGIIGGSAFSGCDGLTSVTIPGSVTTIGSGAFGNCSNLTTLNLNATNWTTGTGSSIVSGPSFTTLNIGNNVTNIPEYAFYRCTTLTSVTIGTNVTNIGRCAFIGCSGITTVYYKARNCNIVGNTPWDGCTNFKTLHIYNNSDIPRGTFKGCNFSNIYAHSSTPPTYYVSGNGLSGTFSSYNAILWVPCGAYNNYLNNWNLFTIRESRAYLLSVSSVNPQMGTARITQHPDCTDGIAIIAATPLRGYAFTQWNDGNTDNPRTLTVTSSCSYTASFVAVPLYTITVVSSDGSMGSATGGGSYYEGETATLTATPNVGCRFVQWNDGNTDNPRTITVTEDGEYTASFAVIPTYTITAVSADETRGTVTGGGTYYEGETVTLTATANDGYVFGSWTDGNTDNPRNVTVTENTTYTATFKAWRTITVISADETQGTVSGGGTYLEDAEIEISATPAEHYHFVQWNDGNTDNPRTITVSVNETYTASFAIDRFTITVETADAEMGTVSESGTYDYGTEIQISATPAEGYGFVAWNDGNTDNPRTITVTEDITYTATFGAWRTITIVSADETQGSVEGTGEYIEGTTIQITAIPNEHYHFVHWIDEENPTRDFNTDNPRTIIVTGNMTYTAVFAIDRHTITVNVQNPAMGTSDGGGTYDYGTEIQISVVVNEGYEFSRWNDGNTDNPRTIIVTGNATYTASFTEIPRYTITVRPLEPEQGTVTGGGSYLAGTEVQLEANPNEGYTFLKWYDNNNTDNPRTITVTGDATYIATFAPNNYTIVVRSLNEDWGTVSEGGTFPYGTEIQISATPRENYAFVAWTDGNTDNPRTITVVADAEYAAAFTWVGAVEQTNFTEITLFPNPATDILNITSSETISEIEIVNVMGQVVRRIEVNSDNAVCDVEDLKAGVYVVRIHAASATLSQRRFIKE